MADGHIAAPDFIPAAVEEEHIAAARRLVRTAPHPRQRTEPTPRYPSELEASSGGARRGLWHWLSERDRRMMSGGAIFAMLGFAALAGFWIWVAVTMNPAGWALAVLGAGLSTAWGITGVRIWRLSVRHSPRRSDVLGTDSTHEQR